MARIAILEGYDAFGRHRRRRRRHRRGSTKLGRASKHCAGKGKRARKKCMRNYMRRH